MAEKIEIPSYLSSAVSDHDSIIMLTAASDEEDCGSYSCGSYTCSSQGTGCGSDCSDSCSSDGGGGCTSYSVVPDVDYWYWDSSNGSASASQTSAAEEAVTYGGHTSEFSYKVWNDLVDKIKEVLDAADESWDSRYATYADTRMSSSDKILTATRFNSARWQVGYHVSTNISEKSPGDKVLGEYFLTIAQCLNAWIDNL